MSDPIYSQGYPQGGSSGPQGGGGAPPPYPTPPAGPYGEGEREKIAVAKRWFDAINAGDIETLDHVVAYDVVDHSGLNVGHGGGCHGHKQLVRQLKEAFPGWRSSIQDISVQGDLVTIRHKGEGEVPAQFRQFLGAAAGDETRRMDFEVVSTVRVKDGKIVEHWANQGPFGQKYPSPPGGTGGGASGGTGGGAGGSQPPQGGQNWPSPYP